LDGGESILNAYRFSFGNVSRRFNDALEPNFIGFAALFETGDFS
jgi:hypothetical protein